MRSADVITICRSHSEFSVRFDRQDAVQHNPPHILRRNRDRYHGERFDLDSDMTVDFILRTPADTLAMSYGT